MQTPIDYLNPRLPAGLRRVVMPVVDATPETIKHLDGYLAHPGLLDSALQTIVAISRVNDSESTDLSLPVGVKQLRFAAPLPPRCA